MAWRQLLVRVFLISSDVLLALIVWQMAFMLHSLMVRTGLSWIAVAGILPSVVVWIGLSASLGLYPGYGLSQTEELRRQTIALVGTLTTVGVLALVSRDEDPFPPVLLFAGFLGLLLLSPVARYFVKRAMMKTSLWGKPVVVMGGGEIGARLLKSLKQEWQLGFNPVGVFDNRLAPADGVLEGVPYEGALTDAPSFARKWAVDTAIFAMPYTRREHLARFVSLASNNFRHVVIIPNLSGVTNSAVVARDLAGTFGVEVRHNLLDPWAQRLKRALDFTATAACVALVLPLVLVLSMLVWTESGGPIFYRDHRTGRDGKLFSCLKFRTMVPNAEMILQRLLEENAESRAEYTKYHKLHDDPRVTRVGRFLRKTSLDELPQLWNVLKGEMSLVGPRPYLPRESGDIGERQSEILKVPPGITGPWQVAGRNHTSFGERVGMDADYVRNWSVWLDLILLARTVQCLLLNRRDAY
jgi:Undecaprenyl-phosphate galactose phosphotransferase WbaP